MAGAAGAQVVEADYDTVAAELGGVFDFEAFEVLPEPGARIDGVILGPGLSIGERFQGQRLHDDPPRESARPLEPEALVVLPGAAGQNHAVAHHAGFGSNALFPIGPAGFERIEGRGEGVTSIRFGFPQAAVGFRLHADYADPLGVRPPPGVLLVHFFDPDGGFFGTQVVELRHGVMSLAFRSLGARIGGIQIEHDDPGGIALDDLLFAIPQVVG